MVLRILEAFFTSYFPTQYAVHIAVGIVTIYVLRVFAQGRKTNRERDLHARVVLVTGGFAPLGLTILQSLAQRGAHIIALTEEKIESPKVAILISLLRSTTSNEQIYAEECDLSSPTSIRYFCTKFLTGKDQRLDAIIFAHEHKHLGSPSLLSTTTTSEDQRTRDANSLATFLITTLLLPSLLVAPVERDIRIIHVVNPFYAAAVGLPFSPTFAYESDPSKANSLFLREGHWSLRTIVLTRHLQRVLDALPQGSQVPKTEEGSSTVPIVGSNLQKSNIVSASVSPGISRVDTISSLLNADWTAPSGSSYLGIALYFSLQPILWIFTKTPISAQQTILHALCLPTPFKIVSQATNLSTNKNATTKQGLIENSQLEMPEEVLRPGALYAECATVKLTVNILPEVIEDDRKLQERTNDSKGTGSLKDGVTNIADDGEYGGELAGRLVWESYERALRVWETETPPTKRDKEKAKSDKEKKAKDPKPAPAAEKEQDYY